LARHFELYLAWTPVLAPSGRDFQLKGMESI